MTRHMACQGYAVVTFHVGQACETLLDDSQIFPARDCFYEKAISSSGVDALLFNLSCRPSRALRNTVGTEMVVAMETMGG